MGEKSRKIYQKEGTNSGRKQPAARGGEEEEAAPEGVVQIFHYDKFVFFLNHPL